MTVYEMIQELSKYDADLEVEINVYSNNFYTEGIAREDANEGEEINIKLNIDEDVSDFCIENYKPYRGNSRVRISLILC